MAVPLNGSTAVSATRAPSRLLLVTTRKTRAYSRTAFSSALPRRPFQISRTDRTAMLDHFSSQRQGQQPGLLGQILGLRGRLALAAQTVGDRGRDDARPVVVPLGADGIEAVKSHPLGQLAGIQLGQQLADRLAQPQRYLEAEAADGPL